MQAFMIALNIKAFLIHRIKSIKFNQKEWNHFVNPSENLSSKTVSIIVEASQRLSIVQTHPQIKYMITSNSNNQYTMISVDASTI